MVQEGSARASGSQQERAVIVPDHLQEIATRSIGAFFEPISHVDRHAAARDFLDLEKSDRRAQTLERYASLSGAKVLEVGSGFGTNLAVWSIRYGANAYGIEPASEGFEQAYLASRELLVANGMDPNRVIDAKGEALPFADETFDIVYSANVLEHTKYPERVLSEALRVLRPGGVLHMEMPNYLAWFEGHYLVPQPPILRKGMLELWVRVVFRRDPSFARTLQTKINPIWCRRVLRRLSDTHPVTVRSLGADLFLERLQQPFVFETRGVASAIGPLVALLQALNRWNWLGRLIVALEAYYPIYLTVEKKHRQREG